jgi:hypothetical protein
MSYFQNRLVAIRAPSASAANFAQTTSGSTAAYPKRCGVGCAQHDVIDPNNVEGHWHGRLLFKDQPILIAAGTER